MRSSTISACEHKGGDTEKISEFCCCSLGVGEILREAEGVRGEDAVGLEDEEIEGVSGWDVNESDGSVVDVDGLTGGASDVGEGDMFLMAVKSEG